MGEYIIDGTGSGYTARVNSDGRLLVDISGATISANVIISGTSIDKVSTLNSYSGTIALNGSWTGTYENIVNYSSINTTTRPGAPGSLYVDFSDNGSTALRTSYIYSTSGTATYTSLSCRSPYYRLRYVNDGTSNSFIVNTLLSEEPRGFTFLPIISPLTDNYTVLSTKSILTGKASNGSYINVGATNGGGLKVSLESWDGPVGSIYTYDTLPTTGYNYKVELVYSGTAIGSIYKMNSAGSYVKVLSYDGSDNLIGVSAWAVA